MVDHPALGVDPADPRARVHAVQVLTGEDSRAVGIDGALRPTCDIGVTKILGDTLTCSSPSSGRADGILPAGRGVAWVYNFGRCWCCKHKVKIYHPFELLFPIILRVVILEQPMKASPV